MKETAEIVRYRDCVHYCLTTCPLCWIEKHALCFYEVDPDFFCAKGERKEDEDE